MTKKIGLIGEDPNDTIAIKNLLLQRHTTGLQFEQLLKRKRGYELNNPRYAAALKIEYDAKRPDFIIFIKDADALPSEREKIKEVEEWFSKLNKVVNNKGILLKNIYELEALILTDIDTFNKYYNVNIKYNKNVMFHKEPKEFLKLKTKAQKQYQESHCPELFTKLNFDKVLTCSEFSKFYEAFKAKL